MPFSSLSICCAGVRVGSACRASCRCWRHRSTLAHVLQHAGQFVVGLRLAHRLPEQSQALVIAAGAGQAKAEVVRVLAVLGIEVKRPLQVAQGRVPLLVPGLAQTQLQVDRWFAGVRFQGILVRGHRTGMIVSRLYSRANDSEAGK